jgi:hypothetical protein
MQSYGVWPVNYIAQRSGLHRLNKPAGERCCKRCGSSMAVLDMMLEAYDLVCVRCGMREVIDRAVVEPHPCYQ